MPKKEPEWFVQRTFIGRKVTEASYWLNSSSAVLSTFHNYGRRDITVDSYCDAHGLSDERSVDFRKLDRMEKDLLILSTEAFQKKYPNAKVSDTHKTPEQVKEEMRREQTERMLSLYLQYA